jgi:hypothetical protein
MTTKEIIAKYPKIFETYNGNPGDVNWFGVPEGWLPIIDKLCGSIQHYIDYVYLSEPNPNYVEGSQYKSDDETTHRFIRKGVPQVMCSQMKEKFGGLRFYTFGHDDIVEGMIKMAEYMCDNTCEECGSENDLGMTTGWITVKCRSCAEKEPNRTWYTKEEWKEKNKIQY